MPRGKPAKIRDFTRKVQSGYKARLYALHILDVGLRLMCTAIVHYWLLNMRGGEKVVEALCRLLPDADIFTLFYDPDGVSETIRSHRVQASFLQPLR